MASLTEVLKLCYIVSMKVIHNLIGTSLEVADKYVGFLPDSAFLEQRYILCKGGTCRGYAITLRGGIWSNTPFDRGDYYIFDTPEELAQWLLISESSHEYTLGDLLADAAKKNVETVNITGKETKVTILLSTWSSRNPPPFREGRNTRTFHLTSSFD